MTAGKGYTEHKLWVCACLQDGEEKKVKSRTKMYPPECVRLWVCITDAGFGCAARW